MPACSNGYCVCSWHWIAKQDNPNSYMSGFLCKIDGASSTVKWDEPQDATWCGDDSSSCVKGAKRPLYAYNNPNNIPFWDSTNPNAKRPGYSDACGFSDGAQDDIFGGSSSPDSSSKQSFGATPAKSSASEAVNTAHPSSPSAARTVSSSHLLAPSSGSSTAASASTDSSSSLEVSPLLLVGGAILVLFLVIGVAVALAHRRHPAGPVDPDEEKKALTREKGSRRRGSSGTASSSLESSSSSDSEDERRRRLSERYRCSPPLGYPPVRFRCLPHHFYSCLHRVSSPAENSQRLKMAPSIAYAAPYTLLPTSPTKAEAASTAFKEKQAHHREASLSLSTATSHHRKQPWRRIATLATLGLAGFGLFTLISPTSVRKLVRAEGELQYTARHKIAYDFETIEVPKDWSCNPFKEPGRLFVDTENKFNNAWRPYEEDCEPSRLVQGVVRSIAAAKSEPAAFRNRGPLRSHDTTVRQEVDEDGSPFYPWLVNATILLQGDSMERLHLSDFCDLIGGQLHNINPKHPASPPIYRKSLPTVLGPDGQETAESINAKAARRQLEDEWEGREKSWFFTRPWVCDIEAYNATVINTFLWGMEDMEDAYQSEDFYHGPSTWRQRFHHITLPMLENLAVLMNRPQIRKPDLIEVSAGYWDLRAMTEEDFMAANISRPYPKDSDLAFKEIGQAREERWIKHATELMKDVATTFPGENGVRGGPPITWRTLHHPKRNNYTPYSRVAALDQLSRKTMHELRISSLATHPTFLSSVLDSLHRTRNHYFPREALDELKAVKEDRQKADRTDYGFDERIRINEIGRLLEGQEDHYRDFLHPDVLPGSYVWGEILLYELKRSFYRVGRSE
ncbi:hypothetical protein JCM11641_004714 [Rhodosporidiobolus odoratus]